MNTLLSVRATASLITRGISIITAEEAGLNVPKLKGVPFETAIIERCHWRESSAEKALIEMYLADVSVRRV